MTILSRYIQKQFLKFFFLGLAAFIILFLIGEFTERIDDIIEHHGEASMAIKYFLFMLPSIAWQMAPLAVLMGVVLTIGSLIRHNELTALLSSGFSLLQIASPLYGIALIISGSLFLMQETILPYSNQKSQFILEYEIKKQPRGGFYNGGKIWLYRNDESIWDITYYDSQQDIMKGITIYRFNDDYQLHSREDIEEGKWVYNGWKFSNIQLRYFNKDGSITRQYVSEKMDLYSMKPDDFKRINKDADEMSLKEIYRYVKKMKGQGYDVITYRVSMHQKLSFPLISLVMVAIGVPLAAIRRARSGLAVGIGMSILIGFSFWGVLSLLISLGNSGRLYPFLSAWGASIIFFFLGLYLVLKVRQ